MRKIDDESLLLDYLHEQLDEAALHALQTRLAREPQLAQQLQSLACEEASIRQWACAQQSRHEQREKAPTVPANSSVSLSQRFGHWRRANFSSRRRWLVGTAALVVAAASLFFIWRSTSAKRPHWATITRSENAQWLAGATPPLRLAHGVRLALAAGIVEVVFPSGARVILAGPAEMLVQGDNRIKLLRGTLSAEVPPAAVGFVVETNRGEVVDLGTRFAVRTSEDGGAEVEVFDGHVRASFEQTERVAVAAGKAIAYRSATHEVQPLAANQPQFGEVRAALQQRSIEAVADHFICGGEQAGRVQTSPDAPSMMIKRDKWRRLGVCRKAYMRFDLSAASPDLDAPAELVLHHLNNHLSGDRKQRFRGVISIYALARDFRPQAGSLGRDWRESQLHWNNAPANVPHDPSGLSPAAVLLQSIDVDAGPGGSPKGSTIAATLPNLHNYLQPDGTLTLIVTVASQPDFDPNLFLASRESPEFPGPLLRFGTASASALQ